MTTLIQALASSLAEIGLTGVKLIDFPAGGTRKRSSATGRKHPSKARLDALAPAGLIAQPGQILDERFNACMVDAGVVCLRVAKENTAELAEIEFKATRHLFDAGFVSIHLQFSGEEAFRFYARPELVADKNQIKSRGRAKVAMSSLGANGRLANQLLQYAFVKLYSLRHDFDLHLPNWAGERYFGLRDFPLSEQPLPELRFQAFDADDRQLWEQAEPICNVDFWGYFQEIPFCWQPHRPLLRKLFSLSPDIAARFEECRARLEIDDRPIAVIHVRRGDYVDLERKGMAWYRTIPEAWYDDWLDRALSDLGDAFIYVATDEPDVVLPLFKRYRPKSVRNVGLPYDLKALFDFDMLRRADQLTVVNSSFSRMASLLGNDSQQAFVVSFAQQAFVPYIPWEDAEFWARFEPADVMSRGMGSSRAAVVQRGLWARLQLGKTNLIQQDTSQALSSLQHELRGLAERVDAFDDLPQDAERDRLQKGAASAHEPQGGFAEAAGGAVPTSSYSEIVAIEAGVEASRGANRNLSAENAKFIERVDRLAEEVADWRNRADASAREREFVEASNRSLTAKVEELEGDFTNEKNRAELASEQLVRARDLVQSLQRRVLYQAEERHRTQKKLDVEIRKAEEAIHLNQQLWSDIVHLQQKISELELQIAEHRSVAAKASALTRRESSGRIEVEAAQRALEKARQKNARLVRELDAWRAFARSRSFRLIRWYASLYRLPLVGRVLRPSRRLMSWLFRRRRPA